jgi:hypothetical protein
VRLGNRATVPLTTSCAGATVANLDQTDGPIDDIDTDPATFTLDLSGAAIGSRILTIDCAGQPIGDLELLVYQQSWSPRVGSGEIALVGALGLGVLAGALGGGARPGVAVPRRRRDIRPPLWFPPDSTHAPHDPPPFVPLQQGQPHDVPG